MTKGFGPQETGSDRGGRGPVGARCMLGGLLVAVLLLPAGSGQAAGQADVCVYVHGDEKVRQGTSACGSDTSSLAVAINGSSAAAANGGHAIAINDSIAQANHGGQAVALNDSTATAHTGGQAIAVDGCGVDAPNAEDKVRRTNCP